MYKRQKCICYNFMPVFDWTRTQLDHELADGSTSLVYYQEQVDAVNPLNSDSDLTLPGWDSSYTKAVSYTHLGTVESAAFCG